MVPRTAILNLLKEQNNSPGGFAMISATPTINYNSLAERKQEKPVFLSDISPSDRPWDTHKAEGEEMRRLLAGVEGDDVSRIRERMAECGEWLIFNHTTPDARGKTFKLREAHFCRVRTCPFCQWRRSLLYTAKMLEAMPKIVESAPTMRFIHLTLTVRNVGIEKLRATIAEMNKAWNRLNMRKQVKKSVRGYVKSIEVTRSEKDGSAHPHIHALLLVPEYYFKIKQYYIKHESWVQLWKEALRLDYSPSVSVQACRQAQGYERIIREVVKYSTKPQDLLRDTEWLVSYIRQVRNLRFFSTGGIVKEVLGELEQERENLIKVGEDQTQDDGILAQSWFDWKKEVARYQHKETRLNPSIPSIIPTNHSVPGGGGSSGGGS